MIFTSPVADVALPLDHLSAYVLRRVADLGAKPALIDGVDGHTLTYGDLGELARRLAGGLAASGFQPGTVAAIMAPNIPEYAVVFHGVALAGGAVTTVNPAYTAREASHQLGDAGASIVFTVGPMLDVVSEAAAAAGVQEVVVLGDGGTGRRLADLYGEELDDPAPWDLDDTVVMPYSSGTTGLSKGVMLSHRSLAANLEQTLAVFDMAERDSFVAVLPFFHIYGMQVLMNLGLAQGATIVTLPRFDLELFLALHERYSLTKAFVAPPVVVALAKHPVVDKYDLRSLDRVFSGAAPLSAELALSCGERLGCEVVQGYGMTELSPVSHVTRPGDFKPGSVGTVLPNTEVAIVDPASGSFLGYMEDGEVWIRGPQVMKGYLNNQDATRTTIDGEGWLHTGDIGHVDPDGHLFIVDRLKELIKFKGFQVAPAELEALLLTHAAVADAAVIGLPDDDAGEIPVAYVVLKDGQQVEPDELARFVADEVVYYKQLRRVTLVDTIPKSASGKILRRVLREQAQGT